MKGKTTRAPAFLWMVAFRRAHFSSLLLALLLPLNARVMEVLESYPLGTDGAERTREEAVREKAWQIQWLLLSGRLTGQRKMGASKSAELTVPWLPRTRFLNQNTISITAPHPLNCVSIIQGQSPEFRVPGTSSSISKQDTNEGSPGHRHCPCVFEGSLLLVAFL